MDLNVTLNCLRCACFLLNLKVNTRKHQFEQVQFYLPTKIDTDSKKTELGSRKEWTRKKCNILKRFKISNSIQLHTVKPNNSYIIITFN